jgi:hypothetical protein
LCFIIYLIVSLDAGQGTTLRPSGYAWRGHAKHEERSVSGEASWRRRTGAGRRATVANFLIQLPNSIFGVIARLDRAIQYSRNAEFNRAVSGMLPAFAGHDSGENIKKLSRGTNAPECCIVVAL